MNRFGQVIIYVKDVVKTIEFYEKAFGIQRSFIHENIYGELDTGSTALGFATEEQARSNLLQDFRRNDPKQLPAAYEISFITKDIEASLERALQAGAKLLVTPTEKPWGQTIAYVQDPNGVLIEIATEIYDECCESHTCCSIEPAHS